MCKNEQYALNLSNALRESTHITITWGETRARKKIMKKMEQEKRKQ